MDIKRIFDRMVDEAKVSYDKDLIETIWYETMKKIANMRDASSDSTRFVVKIQEHVEKMVIWMDGNFTYRTEDLLYQLWVLYVIEADIFKDTTLYETEAVLRSPLFRSILEDYFGESLSDIWKKLVATYEFLKKYKNPRKTAIIKAYYNVWARRDGGSEYLFLGVENRIFPPPVKVKLNYATNKRKRGPNDDGDGGQYGRTQIKVKYGEGSRGGSDDGRTQSRARYAEPSTGRDRGGSDDGRTSTRTKTKPKLRY
jgi:hypothetical protein